MKNEVNKTGKKGKEKKLIIISALALVLTTIMCIAFIATVEAVTTTNSDLDAASLSLSLFKKKPTTPTTGRAIDEFGNKIATVTVKAEEEVGRVRDDFYGVGTYMNFFSEKGTSQICTNRHVNYTWNRDIFLESGMTLLRLRVYLDYIYSNDTMPFDIKVADKILLKNIEDTVKWGYENDITVLLSIVNMPEFLQNRSSGYCNESFWASCPPNNLSASNSIIIHLLNNVTNYGKYNNIILEVGNEYYGEDAIHSYWDFGWLNTVNFDNITKAEEYIKWYNSTYEVIKRDTNLSWIPIVGPVGTIYSPNFVKKFLSDMEMHTDGLVLHRYELTENNQLIMFNDTKTLISWCGEYKNNCSWIIFSEWNIGTESLRRDSFKMYKLYNSYSQSFNSILNSYPSNVTLVMWHWSATHEKAGLYDMVVQPECGEPLEYLRFSPSYNVTKDFAHYHAGGNMIVNSSSNNNSIKSVASLNPQGIWHITVINTATNNINVSIDVSSTGVEAIKDLGNEKIYPVSNGIANVGILKEYDVKHYEGIANYEVEGDTPVSDVSSSSDKGNKVVSVKNLNVNPNEFTAIETGTSKVISTSDIFVYTNTNTNNQNKKEEIEEFYGPIQSEEAINEIDYKSRTGSLSLAVSNKNYLTIAIILLGSIICTGFIITIVYRKKKREADKVKKLMDWVDKARELGYTPEKMKEMLAEYNWDKDLVEKVVGK